MGDTTLISQLDGYEKRDIRINKGPGNVLGRKPSFTGTNKSGVIREDDCLEDVRLGILGGKSPFN